MALAGVLTPAFGQRGLQPPDRFLQSGKADPAEGARVLEGFRAQRISGDYYLDFQLRVLPRRGSERTITGRMWGSRNDEGDIVRVELDAEAGTERLIIQSGDVPAVWNWSAASNTAVNVVSDTGLLTPLAGTDLKAFDLVRPYVFWPDEYEGLSRVSGRPVDQYLLRPPASFAEKYPSLAAVRISVDSQYQAMLRAEYLDAAGKPTQSLTVLELKRLGDDWIVKSVDLRDEVTRNKTRFQVTGAALHQDFPAEIFSPGMLRETVKPPAEVTKIAP